MWASCTRLTIIDQYTMSSEIFTSFHSASLRSSRKNCELRSIKSELCSNCIHVSELRSLHCYRRGTVDELRSLHLSKSVFWYRRGTVDELRSPHLSESVFCYRKGTVKYCNSDFLIEDHWLEMCFAKIGQTKYASLVNGTIITL